LKAQVFSLDGKKIDDIELPKVFSTPYRPDVIHKAFVHLQSCIFQPQGRDPLAGERTSAMSRNTGLGIARMARVKGSGFPRSGQAAGVGGVVKGRLAHHPVSERVIVKRLNKKEKRLALCSAIAATASKELVASRGHRVGNVNLPLIVDDGIEKVSKAKDLLQALLALNLSDDLERVMNGRKKRSGRSRMRGRVERSGKSALIVVGKDEGVGRAASSIPGVDVTTAKNLSVLHLSPGSHPVRLVVWSKSAIEYLQSLSNSAVELMAMVRIK
jgi:large subunit ribosomal protein L4e